MTQTRRPPLFEIGDKALQAGGAAGGKYLDAIGVTDLAALSAAQYDLFIWHVARETLLAALLNVEDAPPF